MKATGFDRGAHETEIVLERIGTKEWLNDNGEATILPSDAATFGSSLEAVIWLQRHVEQPLVWTWVERPKLAATV